MQVVPLVLKRKSGRGSARSGAARADKAVHVRRVRDSDMPAVVKLDAKITWLAKPDYWAGVFAGCEHEKQRRFFLIAEDNGGTERRLLGFIIGEIRAWEFGSAPCGWVFALSVDPSQRLSGAGSALFEAVSAEFKKAGVGKIRTMVARDTRLPLLFFRSEGMRAGPYLQLEKDIE